MTNAEKYKEVFGLEVDTTMCPTWKCGDCPVHSGSCRDTEKWWNSEYGKEFEGD